MRSLLLLLIFVCACATNNTQKVNVNTLPNLSPPKNSGDVMTGIREDCINPPKAFDGLDLTPSASRYNTNPNFPAVAVYMGKKLEVDDVVMICGITLVQNSCKEKYRMTYKGCALPPDPPENPLNEDH